MAKTYKRPDVDLSNVISLLPDHNKGELNPTTPVICVNRGPKELRDQYDANPVVIPPFSKFEAPYGMALHLQRRQIVPGTRHPEAPEQFVSWIGILNVDPPESCEEFDEDFLARYGERKEGINRDEMSKTDQEVQTVASRTLASRLGGLGLAPSSGGGSRISQKLEGGTEETRAAALEPVEGSDASQMAAAALNAGWTPPNEGDLRVHSAPPPKPATAGRKK